MAGFGGRNHRGGKRSSSSSSYCSIVTVVVFLAFCLLGLWLLTSSYVLPSRVLSNRTQSRQNRVTKPTTSESNSDLNSVAFDDNSGDLAGEGKVDLRREEEEESGKETGSSGSGGAEEEQQKNEEKENENEIRQGSEEQQVVTEKEVEVEGQKTENEGGDEKRDSEDEDSKLELVTEKEKESESESEKQEEKNSESEGEKAEESESEKQTETEEKSLELSKVQTEVELDGGEQQEQEQQNSMQEESSENKEQNEQQNEEKVEKDSSESTIETGERVEHRESKEELQSDGDGSSAEVGSIVEQNWELCNVTAGPDYIPCLDNEKALKTVRITGHYEHRERHCPEEGPKCLVPLPSGYRHPIEWPRSRDKIWYNNVPRTKLAEVKGHQNWVKVTGEFLTFPGGGTQFIHGALHYIDFIQKAVPRIAWGKHTRVILDVGCGVASFGGYLFDRDVIAMSFAPKDEHEAQVQFALERGIPAISAVMGTQRLPFPSKVFDIVHCARCRVPWHLDGGALLLELNRVLRSGGYFVWSATPVYQKLEEDVQIWKAMSALTISMCWDLVTIKKDRINSVGAAVYRKPVSNDCYDNRKIQEPPMCKEDDDPNVAWYFSLQACMHRVPTHSNERGTKWPVDWPRRLEVPPYWLNNEAGVYGQPANKDFTTDLEHWRKVVQNSYLVGMDIDWSKIRNVMDMRAVYGGFAAALKDKNVWVMNVVNVDSHDTLPIIFERGLFGMYHDWCESFSTYPRTYDLLHADHLLSGLKKRCEILPVIVEVDRILRPGGKLIVRDEPATVSEVEKMLKSLHWEVRLTFTKGEEGILCAEKTEWRPETFASSS